MAHNLQFILVFVSFLVCVYNVSGRPGTESMDPDVLTTQKPSTVLFKDRLDQLKQLEESALKGWYDMVHKFLMLIKPDDKILEVIIDYAKGTLLFEFPSSAVELAKKNSVFLAIVSLCLAYVIVMFFAGIFFLCCRLCGRCGAKQTQRQTRNINCWRTTHKFCLVFMIAFLVVPVMCMSIINEHMRKSFPSIKGNASGVFNMISTFANDTEQEVNDIAKEQLSDVIRSVQDKENFEKGFATPLESDVSDSLGEQTLNNVRDLISWILMVKKQYLPEVEEVMLEMTENVKELKAIVKNLTDETERFEEHCSKSGNNVCEIALKKLSVDKLDITDVQAEIKTKLKELNDISAEELEDIAQKIQNKTLLKEMIAKKSEELRNFAATIKPKQEEILENLKKEVKKYADSVRDFVNEGQQKLNIALGEADKYELYRWWFMLGISIVLLVPVGFLIIGLVCGCCGYRKGYHPSKRSSLSNCGGMCLVLAVYYFFLVSWLLMMLTVTLFVVGGNIQSFICIPLYQQNFDVLDQVSEKLMPETSDFKNFLPSKLLNDCQNDLSIFEALDIINGSSATIIEQELERRLDVDIETSLKSNIYEETAKIQRLLDEFVQALNLSHEKELPKQLGLPLKEIKTNIEETKEQVRKAVPKDPNLEKDLQLLEKTAQSLSNVLKNFGDKLEHLTSLVVKVYDDARGYVDKIILMKNSLVAVEEKVPTLVHTHLLKYVMSVVNTDISEKLANVGHCEPLWLAFDTTRTVMCNFIVYPVNGFWFGLGWSLIFVIPTIIFAVKLSRHYLRMKYEDDLYRHDEREVVPLDEMSRSKPFSYTNPGNMSWMPQSYMVHPTSSNHIQQFDYK